MPYPRENTYYRAAAPAAGSEAQVVSNTPEANSRMQLHRVEFGYAATAAGGLLTVTDGVQTLRVPCPNAGANEWEALFRAEPGHAITVSLAGVATVAGYVNAQFEQE